MQKTSWARHVFGPRKWARFCEQPKEMTPYAWLYQIARDCLIEAWRHETRGRRDHRRDMPWPEHSSVQLGLGLVTSGTSPSDAVTRKEISERIRTIMQGLPTRDQEILSMRHDDHLSFPEAAQVLGITENGANVRYARALRRLKDRWLRTERRLEP